MRPMYNYVGFWGVTLDFLLRSIILISQYVLRKRGHNAP